MGKQLDAPLCKNSTQIVDDKNREPGKTVEKLSFIGMLSNNNNVLLLDRLFKIKKEQIELDRRELNKYLAQIVQYKVLKELGPRKAVVKSA